MDLVERGRYPFRLDCSVTKGSMIDIRDLVEYRVVSNKSSS